MLRDLFLEWVAQQLVGCLDSRKSVALSTTEADYVAISKSGKEMILLKSFLDELGKKQYDSAFYYGDNQSVIHLVKNPVFPV